MYKFEDTLRTTGQDGGILPAEALAINGRYLDEVIPGFNTLTASGRELLTRSVTTKKVGNSDGEIFMDSTHPMRTITVKFQLVSKTPQEFRNNFEQLTKIIDQPEVKLSFHDDESVFYVGTHVQTGTIPDGKLNVIATMTFQCSDPKAYSKTEKTATNNGTANTIMFTNNGTDLTPVTVTAKMKSDNGFLGLVLNGRAYQIGNPTEVDGTHYDKSETLIPGDPMPNPSTGELNKAGFEVIPPLQGNLKQGGSVKLDPTNGNVLPNGFGDDTYAGPHGPSITYKLPKDSFGNEGCKNFEFYFHSGFGNAANDVRKLGQLTATVHDDKGKALCSIAYSDLTQEKTEFILRYDLNGKNYFQETELSIPGGFTGHAKIIKSGSNFTFKIDGMKASTYICDELKDTKAYYVSFSFLKWKNFGVPAYFGLINWNFRKNMTDLFLDTPNYFKKGDVVVLDSARNELTINGFADWDRVDIGSRPLLANVGDNTLGIVTSEWATMPEVTVNYRERWL